MQNKAKTIHAIINREIRRVPLDWQHPTDERGEPIPLQSRDHWYSDAELEELYAEGHSLEEIESWHMPDFSAVPEDQLGLCVYETTTEGTPMTPVFVDTPEGRWALVHYCANNVSVFADRMTNAEAWAELLFGSRATLNLATGRLEFRLEGEPRAA